MSLLRSLPGLTSTVAITATVATLALTAPAHAEGDGTGVIQGVVLETGHVIAPGIDVSLYLASGEFVDATVANSEAGAYQFSGLKAGSYTLWFENQNEAVSEWYDNQPDKPQATPIVLGDGATYVADAYLTQVSENLSRPTVTGATTVGSTLTAGRGAWYPTSSVEFRYQWWRGTTMIDGATQQTYTLRNEDSGSRMSVEVIAVHQGATESATSIETATVTGGTPPVTPTITSSAAPTVSGSTVAGATLTATTGTWVPADASVSLTWTRGGTVVGSGPTYTTGLADVGATLIVKAAATRSSWLAGSAQSAAFGPITAPVLDPPAPPAGVALASTGAPSISGTARVGDLLTASGGTWSGTPTGIAYQWTRDGVAVPGATGATYRLTAADVARRIGVTVTASNAAGSGSASAASGSVAKAASTVAARVSSPKKGRVKVAVSVTSAGERRGRITVTVKVSGTKTTKTYAVKGARTLTLTGLRRGTASVTVAYSGDASTAAARAVKRVTVR